MLFADNQACFSPSVHSAYRKAWVNHGGFLTHTENDFYEAQYFFCDGLDDPWLPHLISRRIIVRHPHWIAHCISEKVIMPIAAFTLDNRFEPEVIKFAESISRDLIESCKAPQRIASEVASDVSATSSVIKTRYQTNLRKRPLEDDTVERARVVKRSKIDTTGSTPRTSHKPRLKSQICISQSPSEKRAHSWRDDSSPCHRTANTVALNLESEIDANVVNTVLLQAGTAEHMAFWECIDSLKQSGRTPLSLRVEDVLRAPEIRSTLFRRGSEYMGKPFHVNRKDPNSMSSTMEKPALVAATVDRGQERGKEHPRSKPAALWLDLRTVVKRRGIRSKHLRFEV